MNVINVDVLFKSNYAEIKGFKTWPKAVSGDYNSTKMVFNFDREDGTKILEIKNPLTDEIVYKDTIRNNESILVGYTEVLDENNYVKYTDDEENIYWYDKENNVVYNSEYQESQVEIETLTKVKGDVATIFANEGDYICEISLYGNDSKLSVLSFILPVGPEAIKDNDKEAIIYKPVFDSLINTVNEKIEEMESVKQEVIHANEEAERIISEFEEDVDTYTTAFNQNAEEKINAVNQIYENTEELVNGFDSKVEAAEDDLNTIVSNAETIYNNFNTNAAAKLNEYNTNASNKFNEYNTNASSKISAYNTNATEKVEAYNTNATSKLNAYNDNATSKTTAFDTNATNKTNTFDSNAESKTTAFNTNASDKTTAFNNNADEKTTEYNENAQEKVDEFNQTVDSIQESIDDHEERISDLERNQKTGSATGTEIDLTDAFDTRPRYLGIDATETKQETIRGKNLANSLELTEQTINGITFTPHYTNGMLDYINVNGTATDRADYKFTNNFVLEANTYNVSKGIAISDVRMLGVTVPGGAANINIDSVENRNYTISETTTFKIWLRVLSGISVSNVKIYPMIEVGSSKTGYEPFTGGQSSPSPEFPSDVKTMVGITNEFNINNIVNTNNIEISNNNIVIKNGTGYTETTSGNTLGIIAPNLKVGLTYYLKFNTTYDGTNYNKIYIVSASRFWQSDTSLTITQEMLNSKIAFYGKNDDSGNPTVISSLIVTEGTEEKPYVPYGTNYMVLDEVGKNLLPSIVNWEIGDISTAAGGTDVSANNYIRTKGLYKCQSNTNYYFSYNGNYRYSIYFYDDSKTFLGRLDNVQQSSPRYFTTPVNCYYYRVAVRNEPSSTDIKTDEILINKFQLEFGTVATPYEPYQHKQYPISLANQELLNKNNYVDKIIVDETNKQVYIEKLWGKVVLDGSEDWQDRPNYNETDRFVLDNALPSSNRNILSNYFVIVKTLEPTYPNMCNNYGQLVINYSQKNTTTLDNFKSWLSNHNTEVYYPLATPQLIPIDNPNIKLLNGVNHITNSEGAEMDIVYVKDINAYLENELSNIKNAIIELGGEM